MRWRSSWLRPARHIYGAPRARQNFPNLPTNLQVPRRSLSSESTRTFTHAQLLRQASVEAEHDVSKTESIKNVRVAGIVRSARWKKSVVFASIHDGTTYELLQAVLPIELATGAITNGGYVELVGTWQASPAQGQSHELQVTGVQYVGASDAMENPIQKASMTSQFLRTIPHMRIRTPLQSLLARARSQLISAADNCFTTQARPVIQVQPPIITSSDCEGAGEVFTLSRPGKGEKENEDFFKGPKYLTVSSQLHLEAWSADLGDVWALSPAFRAEESDTGRHLAEFYMLEAEFRSIDSLELLMDQVNIIVTALCRSISTSPIATDLLSYYHDSKHRPPDSAPIDLRERWERITIASSQWLRITYSDAIKQLQEAHQVNPGVFNYNPVSDRGLALEHERWLAEEFSGGKPVFVTHYPRHLKPFYMLPSKDSALKNPTSDSEKATDSTVSCFDLLLPFGYAEVCGGSLREHRLEHLIAGMREKGLLKKAISPEESVYPHLRPGESLGSLQWYADLRRFGSSRHGGFGIGFDRLLGYLTGISNLRDVAGFPRYWGTCQC